MRRLVLTIASILALTGCNQQSSSNVSSDQTQSQLSVLASLRPHANPETIEKIKQEEIERLKQQAADAAASAKLNYAGNNPGLPNVSQAPFASGAISGIPVGIAPANAAPKADVQPASTNSAKNNNQNPLWSFGNNQNQAPVQPVVMSYGSYSGSPVPPPPPGSSLVPPPPAVSLSTSVQMAPYGTPNSYPYPYMDPYGQHPAGSLFASGRKAPGDQDVDDSYARERKLASFVPITPTGMDARSSYKQRDDVKILWKGAIANSPLSKDEKLANNLSKVEVRLPSESSKGSLSVSPRQLDSMFKHIPLDKKINLQVKQLQADLIQAYYRYLYSYNKYALAQQTVAARKQEVDIANTLSEKQKAAADLSSAQSDADAAKEDMKSAQLDLVAKAGIQPARSIIGRVSGTTPNADSLIIADSSSSDESTSKKHSIFGTVESIFGIGGRKEAKPSEEEKAEPKKQRNIIKIAGMGKNNKNVASSEDDLQPAPEAISSDKAKPSVQTANASSSSNPVSFELKNVDLSPRKSTLKVCIHNRGSADFNFDPEGVSILEGNHKITGAAVRAEFDTTLVQPDQEVTGTIVIYGHPWNDHLTVALADGGRLIQLKR